MTCPVDMDVPTDEGLPTSSFDWENPTATDNDGGEPSVVCTADNSPMVLGENTITCTATDSGGLSVECSYTITVKGNVLSITKLAEQFGNIPKVLHTPNQRWIGMLTREHYSLSFC